MCAGLPDSSTDSNAGRVVCGNETLGMGEAAVWSRMLSIRNLLFRRLRA